MVDVKSQLGIDYGTAWFSTENFKDLDQVPFLISDVPALFDIQPTRIQIEFWTYMYDVSMPLQFCMHASQSVSTYIRPYTTTQPVAVSIAATVGMHASHYVSSALLASAATQHAVASCAVAGCVQAAQSVSTCIHPCTTIDKQPAAVSIATAVGI